MMLIDGNYIAIASWITLTRIPKVDSNALPDQRTKRDQNGSKNTTSKPVSAYSLYIPSDTSIICLNSPTHRQATNIEAIGES